MAIIIRDSQIDADLNYYINDFYTKYGIRISKVDVIRKLLHQRKQGKKTNKRWEKMLI